MALGGSSIQLRGQELLSVALTGIPSSGDKGGGGGRPVGLDDGDQRGVGEGLRRLGARGREGSRQGSEVHNLGRRACQQGDGPIHGGSVAIANQLIKVGLSLPESVIPVFVA
jgi:hypothetical protein